MESQYALTVMGSVITEIANSAVVKLLEDKKYQFGIKLNFIY